jgi:hypothetical protein
LQQQAIEVNRNDISGFNRFHILSLNHRLLKSPDSAAARYDGKQFHVIAWIFGRLPVFNKAFGPGRNDHPNSDLTLFHRAAEQPFGKHPRAFEIICTIHQKAYSFSNAD